MTKAEAISQLQERIDLINKDYFDLQLDKYAEALEMAIEALNQFAGVDKKVSAEGQEGDLITSAQPDVPDIYAGDMIYRQAAVDAIDALHDKPNAWLDYAVDAVMALPSAQPEIVRCKDCEYGEQDEVGRWFCRGIGCQIGSEDGSGYCADAERRNDE